jgi:hypothetical protein
MWAMHKEEKEWVQPKDSRGGVRDAPNLGEDETLRHKLDHLYHYLSYETRNIQQGYLL